MTGSTQFDLSGKIAIVTGGNNGIGFAIAKALSAAGAEIFIVGRSIERNASAAKQITERGGKASYITADVTSLSSVNACAAEFQSRSSTLNILVNCAGINIRRLPEEYTEEEIYSIIETNLMAPFRMARAFKPMMTAAGGGKIINIGSLFTARGGAKFAPYAASKGGLHNLTMSLAAAWGGQNIQTNMISPGWIDTDLTRKTRLEIPTLDDTVKTRTPAGRWGSPDDFEGIAVFLASDASNFVNGVSIEVDGGFSGTV
jgi:2-deoxy-D-gluconate 3-dehydrogenase